MKVGTETLKATEKSSRDCCLIAQLGYPWAKLQIKLLHFSAKDWTHKTVSSFYIL